MNNRLELIYISKSKLKKLDNNPRLKIDDGTTGNDSFHPIKPSVVGLFGLVYKHDSETRLANGEAKSGQASRCKL